MTGPASSTNLRIGRHGSRPCSGAGRKRAAALGGIVIFAGLLLALLGTLSAQVHDPEAVKAAFVFNITKYVEWRQARQELTIGFVGDGPMGERLKSTLAGKASESRTIQVLLAPSDETLGRCDMLYVGRMSRQARRTILEKIRNSAVLTVGDGDSFTKEGGMVGLVTVGDHVQLQINQEAVQAASLKISSRLLSVAVLVHTAAGARK